MRLQPEGPIVAYTLFAASCMAIFARVVSRSPWMNGKWDFWWDDWITLSCLVRMVYHQGFEEVLMPLQIMLIITAIFSYFCKSPLLFGEYMWPMCRDLDRILLKKEP